MDSFGITRSCGQSWSTDKGGAPARGRRRARRSRDRLPRSIWTSISEAGSQNRDKNRRPLGCHSSSLKGLPWCRDAAKIHENRRVTLTRLRRVVSPRCRQDQRHPSRRRARDRRACGRDAGNAGGGARPPHPPGRVPGAVGRPQRAHGEVPGRVVTLREEVTALLQELLRVNTVNPPGNETIAAELLRDYLERQRDPVRARRPLARPAQPRRAAAGRRRAVARAARAHRHGPRRPRGVVARPVVGRSRRRRDLGSRRARHEEPGGGERRRLRIALRARAPGRPETSSSHSPPTRR